MTLGPWARRLAAILAGVGAALAHPPLGLLPGLIGYAVLLWLLDTARDDRPKLSAFLMGWLAGTAYFAVGTWWIAEAFFVDIASHGWMAPFAVTFMAGGLGLFWGAAGAAYRAARPTGVLRLVLFATVLAVFEWLRGHVLTGFPWNLPGETWLAGSAMSQTASLVGAYGLTWITLAIAAAPAVIGEGRKGFVALGLSLVALSGLWLWGAAYRGPITPPPATAPMLRIVQPNLPQEAKYDPARFAAIVQQYIAFTAQPVRHGERTPDIIFWPEGAIPASANDYLAPGTWTAAAIAGAVTPDQTLVLGAYRVDRGPALPLYYNVLLALKRNGDAFTALATYDKYRLVPFGEYLPLEPLMTAIGFKKLVKVGDGFSIGPRPRPVTVGAVTMQPLICYEVLFPGFTREGAAASGRRAQLIVNLSNDAWFGSTSGPLQHLNLASYRAIEEGLPMVRATPTGVSAVIDAHGRIAPGQRLELGEAGVIDAPMPAALAPTLFAKWGDGPFWLFVALTTLAQVIVIVRKTATYRQKYSD